MAKPKTTESVSPSNRLDLFRAMAKKSVGEDIFEQDRVTSQGVEYLSTGIMTVDMTIAGEEQECLGFPKAAITEVYGYESSGKTTLCLQGCAETIREGGVVVYVDFEHALQPAYAKALGVPYGDESKFIHLSPATLEDGMQYAVDAVRANVTMVVIDSIAAMSPKKLQFADQEKGERRTIQDVNQPGVKAKAIAGALENHLVPAIGKNGSMTSVVVVNQIRANIKLNAYAGGSDTTTPGGNALKFYCNLRIELQCTKKEYKKTKNPIDGKVYNQPLGNIVRMRIVKSKVSSSQGTASEYYLRFGRGIDPIRTAVDLGLVHKFVSKAGAWYEDKASGLRAQGKDALITMLRDDPAAFGKLEQNLRDNFQKLFAVDTGSEVVDDDDLVVMDADEDANEGPKEIPEDVLDDI